MSETNAGDSTNTTTDATPAVEVHVDDPNKTVEPPQVAPAQPVVVHAPTGESGTVQVAVDHERQLAELRAENERLRRDHSDELRHVNEGIESRIQNAVDEAIAAATAVAEPVVESIPTVSVSATEGAPVEIEPEPEPSREHWFFRGRGKR